MKNENDIPVFNVWDIWDIEAFRGWLARLEELDERNPGSVDWDEVADALEEVIYWASAAY